MKDRRTENGKRQIKEFKCLKKIAYNERNKKWA